MTYFNIHSPLTTNGEPSPGNVVSTPFRIGRNFFEQGRTNSDIHVAAALAGVDNPGICRFLRDPVPDGHDGPALEFQAGREGRRRLVHHGHRKCNDWVAVVGAPVMATGGPLV